MRRQVPGIIGYVVGATITLFLPYWLNRLSALDAPAAWGLHITIVDTILDLITFALGQNIVRVLRAALD